MMYFVKDENTLCYRHAGDFEGIFGVLASNKYGHNPVNGIVYADRESLRPATENDFVNFRVQPPVDFRPAV